LTEDANAPAKALCRVGLTRSLANAGAAMTIATAARAAIWLFVDMIILLFYCDVDKSPDPFI
jgi:hypothetical protein